MYIFPLLPDRMAPIKNKIESTPRTPLAHFSRKIRKMCLLGQSSEIIQGGLKKKTGKMASKITPCYES